MFPPVSLGRVVGSPKRHARIKAFTLVEMLTVVAIIGIATAMLMPAFNGLQKSGLLTNGGNSIMNLASLARQDAISKNTLSALVVLGDQGTEDDYRAACVMEYSAETGWSVTRNWEKLPTGILMDWTGIGQGGSAAPGADSINSFFTRSPTRFPFIDRIGQSDPPFSYHGQTVKEGAYAFRVFLPNGALQNPDENAQIRLVQGVRVGKAINYTNKGGQQAAQNYYDIIIIGATGTAKAIRP